mgnify:CR=1 FL=1
MVVIHVTLTYFRCNKYKNIIKTASTRYRSDRQLRHSVGSRLNEALTTLSGERSYQSHDLQQPNILLVRELSASPIWSDDEFFSDITMLESRVDDITREFNNAYLNLWPTGWLINNTASGEWAVFHLINQGAAVKKNCDECPLTYGVINQLVGSMQENVFANVSFSVVQPGTSISPHYGPTNVRIRCHLGLQVSRPDTSYMTVNGRRVSWKYGRCSIFDDSFLHGVDHSADNPDPRAVLLVDFWHPELTELERSTIDSLFKFQRPATPTIHTIPIRYSTEM